MVFRRNDMGFMIRKCDQGCGAVATVYAGDSCASGWAGFYCEPCQQALSFDVWDKHPEIEFVLITLNDSNSIKK